GADFYTVSAQKWLCGPDPSGALYVRDPERLRVALPSAFSPESHEDDGAFAPKAGARRFDSGWIGAPPLAGLEAALGVHPDWRYEAAAASAARCRELLAPLVEVVTPAGQSTLVSFRPPGDPTELVAALGEHGVLVRELPGRNLVRASCGWWANEADLPPLVDGRRAAGRGARHGRAPSRRPPRDSPPRAGSARRPADACRGSDASRSRSRAGAPLPARAPRPRRTSARTPPSRPPPPGRAAATSRSS